jgi:hypothetical protein
MASLEINTAAVWDTWRRLYPLYSNLARECVIDAEPCVDLESGLDVPGAESVAEAEAWFATMDSRIHIHHLRHFAQTSSQMSEHAISDLLSHCLQKKQKREGDRDKADFLVVQLIAMRLPPRASKPEITLESVMKLLAIAGGNGPTEPPKFASALEQMIGEAEAAKDLNALFTSRIIERCREMKQSCGNQFFTPVVLAAFARFGFLLRSRFFQLMQQDLNAVLDGLRELEARGVESIDCRKAQFSAEEPIARIRMISQSWRVMFQAEYSSGQPLCLLVDLKTAVESALQTTKLQSANRKAAAASAAHQSAR